jgi:hypothetical protein
MQVLGAEDELLLGSGLGFLLAFDLNALIVGTVTLWLAVVAVLVHLFVEIVQLLGRHLILFLIHRSSYFT